MNSLSFLSNPLTEDTASRSERRASSKSRTRSKKPYERSHSTHAPWTEEQIQILIKGVEEHPGKWSLISNLMNGAHTNEECRNKAATAVVPGVKKGKWSTEEILILRQAIQEHPKKWSQISRDYFHGTRSSADVRRKALKLDSIAQEKTPFTPPARQQQIEERLPAPVDTYLSDDFLELLKVLPIPDFAVDGLTGFEFPTLQTGEIDVHDLLPPRPEHFPELSRSTDSGTLAS